MLIHPVTARQLNALVSSKPQAILISGSAGSGKQTIAKKLSSDVLGRTLGENDPYFLNIFPEKSSIGIESIRNIRSYLSRKSTGKAVIRRIILISDAHTMTTEAQNALLKTLEEPPTDTMVILTTDDLTALKLTIRSRSHQLQVLPIDEISALEYFKLKGSEHAIRTAYYMSDGRIGLLSSLLEQASGHELVVAINDAKSLIQMSSYEKLLRVEALSKQKDQATLLLSGLERVVQSGLRQAANKNDETAVKKFYHLSKLVYSAQDLFSKSVNAKIVLTDLFINM